MIYNESKSIWKEIIIRRRKENKAICFYGFIPESSNEQSYNPVANQLGTSWKAILFTGSQSTRRPSKYPCGPLFYKIYSVKYSSLLAVVRLQKLNLKLKKKKMKKKKIQFHLYLFFFCIIFLYSFLLFNKTQVSKWMQLNLYLLIFLLFFFFFFINLLKIFSIACKFFFFFHTDNMYGHFACAKQRFIIAWAHI